MEKTVCTISDYDAVARAYDVGNRNHDVSQNIEAFMKPLKAAFPDSKLSVLDLGCAGGRDLETFEALGCDALGIDGSPALLEMAAKRIKSGRLERQDFADLGLEANSLHGVYANAVFQHVPSDVLENVLDTIFKSLKSNGIFFVSTAHGFGEDKEHWMVGRTQNTRSWCCFWSDASWRRKCEAAGFELIDDFFRGNTKAFYASAWQKR